MTMDALKPMLSQQIRPLRHPTSVVRRGKLVVRSNSSQALDRRDAILSSTQTHAFVQAAGRYRTMTAVDTIETTNVDCWIQHHY